QCHLLVWYEEQADMYWALQRERNFKHWVRDWKDALIEKDNPEWDDLYFGITQLMRVGPRVKPEGGTVVFGGVAKGLHGRLEMAEAKMRSLQVHRELPFW